MYIKPLMPAGLATNVAIMPQFFKKAGYATHAIGKWHLGYCHQNYTPTYRGFDTFYGFYLGSQVKKGLKRWNFGIPFNSSNESLHKVLFIITRYHSTPCSGLNNYYEYF